MRCRLFNFVSLLSLVLLAATLVLWASSYLGFLSLDHEWGGDRHLCISAYRGTLRVQHTVDFWTYSPRPVVNGSTSVAWSDPPVQFTTPDSGTCRDWRLLGFAWYESNGGVGPNIVTSKYVMTGDQFGQRWWVEVPLWSLALLGAVPPVHSLWVRSRRRVQASKGLCVHCGYDLRSTPERCPECGRETGTRS